MQEYYNRRAEEYEQIYHRSDPSRQAELDMLAGSMCADLAGLDVIEIACGTGFWTERLSTCARRIVATDASDEMLRIATAKSLPPNVQFTRVDAYDLSKVGGTFSGGVANFWFSHVPKGRLAGFLTG